MAYQLNKTYLLFCYSGLGQCLSVSGGTVANNRNVCIGTKTGGTAQSWTIKQFGSNYKIVSNLNQNYALNYYWSSGKGNPGNCDIYPQSGNDADSSIVLEPISTDVYRIKLKNYNLYLTAKGEGNNSEVRWEAPVNLSRPYVELAPQEWRILDPAEKGIRAPLIYAGYDAKGDMYKYTDEQLSGMENATEFVICSGVYDKYFTSDGTPAPDYIQNYVVAATSMAERLYTMYHKQVWIGTPVVGGEDVVPYTQSVFATVARHMTYFIDNIITQFRIKGLDFNDCVKGIYMSDEGVQGEFNASTDISENWEVSMFQTVANYAAAKGKKMLWIPYWGTENLKKVACVIHRTNIFDYALIQPHYYFDDRYAADLNCAAIRTAIAIQRVCYQGGRDDGGLGLPILHETSIICTKTVIGLEMEIDYRAVSNPTLMGRYESYEQEFDQTDGAYDKSSANMAFYLGSPQSTTDKDYTVVKNIMNNFFR